MSFLFLFKLFLILICLNFGVQFILQGLFHTPFHPSAIKSQAHHFIIQKTLPIFAPVMHGIKLNINNSSLPDNAKHPAQSNITLRIQSCKSATRIPGLAKTD
jgi:hypothetical protein